MKIINHLHRACLILAALGLPIIQPSNASLQFNGSNSKAVLDGTYLDGTTHSSYTFEVWIKPLTLGGTLIGKTEYWKEWTLDTEPDGGLMLRGAWPNVYWGTEVAAGSITTNVWQHVCCAVNNGQAAFYVNGNLVGTEAVHDPLDFYADYPDASAPSLDADMAIGYTDSGTTPDYNFFNGLIYGIKVWSRTLSASEVQAIAITGVPPSTNGLYNAVLLNEDVDTVIHDSLTSLTGRVLTAGWSLDAPTFNTHPPSFLTNGLVAYYPFNGNASDASGNAHNGVVNGAVLTTNRFGTPNAAYYFDGVSAYIVAPLSNAVFAGDFTASVWFIAYDYADGWPTLLDAQNNSLDAFAWAIGGQQSSASGVGWLGAQATYASRSFCWGVNLGHPVPLNTYSHAVIAKAGTAVTMYWNGVVAATCQVTHSIPAAGQYLFIGRSDVAVYSEAWAFHGVIDDIRIYDRGLSSNEVAELYQYESTPPVPPCIPHAATASPNLDNGFLVGATITDAGCGYTNTPSVRIVGGDGSGAQAVAVVSNGVVTAVNLLKAGSGYTNAPVVVIAPPFIPQPTMGSKALLFGPLVTPVIELDLANLSPYDNYQLEFCPVAGGTWTNLANPFTPTANTNTQYVNTIGNVGFFRVKYVR